MYNCTDAQSKYIILCTYIFNEMENSHKFSLLFFAKFLQHGFLTNVKEICKILLFIFISELTLEQDDSINNVTKTKPKNSEF